jgi:hypothetical protein
MKINKNGETKVQIERNNNVFEIFNDKKCKNNFALKNLEIKI